MVYRYTSLLIIPASSKSFKALDKVLELNFVALCNSLKPLLSSNKYLKTRSLASLPITLIVSTMGHTPLFSVP